MPLPKFEDENFEFPDEKEEKAKAKAEAKKDDDFQLEIEDDTPPEDRGRRAAPPPEEPTEDELASYDEKVQARIKKFTRGYHDERRAKEAAERERQTAEDFARQVFEENKRLQQQLSTGSKAYIETSKGAAQGELDAAKKRYRDAYEAGNADELVASQEDIAKATLKIDKAQGLRPIEVEDREYKPATQSAEPKVSPKTKRWLENNSDWFGTDDEMTMSAMGLDKRLQKEYGADYIGTDDYFKRIDSTMRKRFPEYFDTQSHEEDDTPQKRTSEPDEDETPRRAQKPSSSPVAPASRSTPPNRIKLKTSQVTLARKLGITPEQYAKQVALLTRGE
jgi:hypothetical protein